MPARWPARSADLELALDLMSGPDRWNTPGVAPGAAAATGDRRSPQLRVASWFDDEACPLDPEVADVARTASSTSWRRAGCRVEREVTPGFDLAKATARFHALVTAAISGGFSATQIEEFALAEGDDPVAVTKRHTSMRHRQWLSHNESRLQLRRRFETFFEGHDVLLLPVMPCVAIHHDHTEPIAGAGRADRAGPAPVLGDSTGGWRRRAPATCRPPSCRSASPASGLPVGIQIVGPYLHDRTTLAFAAATEAIVGPCPTPPG